MTILPRFAVVVPTYQSALYVLNTLECVAAQTLPPAEIIVVDDGSTDGTVALVNQFALEHATLPVRCLREGHRGPGAARNAGVRAATSEWIAFLDSDDMWRPAKLQRVADAIAAHAHGTLFCHNEVQRGLDGQVSLNDYAAAYVPSMPLPVQLFERNLFSTSAVVARREAVLRCGGFDESLSSAQDYELWLRMSPEMVPVFIPEVLGTYVVRRGNISTTRHWRRLRNLLRVHVRHRGKVSLQQFLVTVAKHGVSNAIGIAGDFGRRVLGHRANA